MSFIDKVTAGVSEAEKRKKEAYPLLEYAEICFAQLIEEYPASFRFDRQGGTILLEGIRNPCRSGPYAILLCVTVCTDGCVDICVGNDTNQIHHKNTIEDVERLIAEVAVNYLVK